MAVFRLNTTPEPKLISKHKRRWVQGCFEGIALDAATEKERQEMNNSDWIIFVLIILCVASVLIAALVGFILVQIKARIIWRLLSITVVLIGSCWFCSFNTRETIEDQYSETYMRGGAQFIEAIDHLNIEGDTNDVHQSCQKFLDYFFISPDKQDVSNFDKVVGDTCDLAYWRTNTVQGVK